MFVEKVQKQSGRVTAARPAAKAGLPGTVSEVKWAGGEDWVRANPGTHSKTPACRCSL